jgi:methyl-accepting chemotaxis protein
MTSNRSTYALPVLARFTRLISDTTDRLSGWAALRRRTSKAQATANAQAGTAVLQHLAQLDQHVLEQLNRAIGLSEASSMNTVGRVTDLHQLSNRLVDYLQTAKQQSVSMQQAIEHNGSIATEFATFVQELPQQIAQEREYLERMVSDVRNLSSISETIRDMARQTEILAINAAIAAAHAGEAGRAFSVLAGEVRRLALQSSTSAQTIEQNISRLVETVQARKTGEFSKRMQHNEREVARLLALTSKFDEGYLDMRQFYAMLLTAVTEHNTELNRGIVAMLEAGQYHDVFKQIIDRQAPVFTQRHSVLTELVAQLAHGQPDLTPLDTQTQALVTDHVTAERAHQAPDMTAGRANPAAPLHIELF